MKFGDPKSIEAVKKMMQDAEHKEELEENGKRYYCTVYYSVIQNYEEDIVVDALDEDFAIDEATDKFLDSENRVCGEDVEVDEVVINGSIPFSDKPQFVDTKTLEMFPENKDE